MGKAVLHATLAGLLVCTSVEPSAQGPWGSGDSGFLVIPRRVASKRALDDATDSLKTIWPGARGMFGIPQDRRWMHLEVNLYGDVESYVRADLTLTGGEFGRNLAFSHHDTRTAHVALQPQLTEAALERIGLPALTRRLLLHEAAHVVRYHVHEDFRSHPRWIVDGAAAWLAQTALEKAGSSQSFELDPFTATEIGRVQTLHEQERMPPLRDVLRGSGGLDFYETYAVHTLLFRYAWERAEATGLAELGEWVGERARQDLDTAFEEYARSLRPAWTEVRRMLDTSRDPWVQVAFPEEGSDAVAWNRQTTSGDQSLSGAIEFVPNHAGRLDVLLDRDPDGCVAVSFHAGEAVTVSLRRNDGTEPEWGRAEVSWDPFAKTAFEVRVVQDSVRVFLNGEERLTVDDHAREYDGAWGLGARAGTAGLWHGVTLD